MTAVCGETDVVLTGTYFKKRGEKEMDGTTMIRVVAGALAVVVLFVIVWRRRRKAIE